MSALTSTNVSFILISLHFRGTAIVEHHGMPVRQVEAVLQVHLVCRQLCQLDAEISS